ncbi:UNVERIFIED_CONTAM: hypothetical protein K2H54_075502 [Gekko kuhli]
MIIAADLEAERQKESRRTVENSEIRCLSSNPASSPFASRGIGKDGSSEGLARLTAAVERFFYRGVQSFLKTGSRAKPSFAPSQTKLL